MKKLFTMVLLVSTLLTLSCSKESEETSLLNGTKWAYSYIDGYIVLEFSDSTVMGYYADSNLILDGSTYTADYTIDGNNVYFDDLIICWSVWRYRYKDVVLSGSTMSAKLEEKLYNADDWTSYSWQTKTFQKL